MKFTWQKEDNETETVKSFLSKKGVSHRMFRSIKHKQGKVLVNQRRKTLNFVLQAPSGITLLLDPEKPDLAVPPSDGQLNVIYEDSNWLIVDKQAGLNSVPGPSDRSDTLVNRVKGHLIMQKAKDLVPHVLTRLDRFTSGVTLIAKHRFAQGLINRQMESHSVDKRYLALVEGQLEFEHGLIDQPLRQAPNSYAQEVNSAGKQAQTEYWIKENFGTAATLVEVQLHTGRTHQIRAHFKYLGHPLLADELYGGKFVYGLQRQALHATDLSFIDPFTNKQMIFHSQIPADLVAALQQLRSLGQE